MEGYRQGSGEEWSVVVVVLPRGECRLMVYYYGRGGRFPYETMFFGVP